MPRRLPVVFGLLAAVAAAWFLARPAEVEATQLNPQLVAALRELQETKQKLAVCERQNAVQAELLQAANRQVALLTEELRLEKQPIRGEAHGVIRQLRQQLAALQGIKYAHYSVWKRKPFVRPNADDAFVRDVYGVLAKLPSVRGVWVGGTSVPNEAGGEMVVLMLFDDREAHKRYMEDPVTRQFNDNHGRRWQVVKALDVLVR